MSRPFSTFASSLLSSSTQTPLFLAHAEAYQSRHPRTVQEDILGESYEEEIDDTRSGGGTREQGTEQEDLGNGREDRMIQGSSLGLSNVVPAFVSRLGRVNHQSGASNREKGWKAYQSLTATRHLEQRGILSDSEGSDLSGSEEDEGPIPGTYVSNLPSNRIEEEEEEDHHNRMDEPLIRRQTLYIYPGSGPSDGSDQRQDAKEVYRDSTWIVVYGLCLATTLFLSIQAYLSSSPTTPSSPPNTPTSSLLSATPLFATFSLVSLFTSSLALLLLLMLRTALRPLLTLSIFVGPFLFACIGVTALSGSFGSRGVEQDSGWKAGMRVFAVVCILLSIVLGRASLKRRKELNRAILIGELACQTIIRHPPLILLALTLSFVSTLLSLPFVALITSLLSLSPSNPRMAAYGSSFVLFTYLWTLALLRGIGKATTAGAIGTCYFTAAQGEESADTAGGEEEAGVIEITRAAFARATGPSLGTILLSSLLTTLFQTLSTLLRSFARVLRRSKLPPLLSPLTYLIPICDFLAGWASWFNGYTTVYAGLTGKTANESARNVASLMFTNRGANIRDATLLRLLLTLTLLPLTLFPSLVSFLILSSSYLGPQAGGYAPMLAVLSVVVPGWTARVVLGLVTDAIDTLFIATHLDAENEEKSCPKAVEAFGEGEQGTLARTFV